MAKVRSEWTSSIRACGLLVDALGYSGTARFLRHFGEGNGNYLAIQEKLFKGMRLDQMYKRPASIIPTNSVDAFPSRSAGFYFRPAT